MARKSLCRQESGSDREAKALPGPSRPNRPIEKGSTRLQSRAKGGRRPDKFVSVHRGWSGTLMKKAEKLLRSRARRADRVQKIIWAMPLLFHISARHRPGTNRPETGPGACPAGLAQSDPRICRLGAVQTEADSCVARDGFVECHKVLDGEEKLSRWLYHLIAARAFSNPETLPEVLLWQGCRWSEMAHPTMRWVRHFSGFSFRFVGKDRRLFLLPAPEAGRPVPASIR